MAILIDMPKLSDTMEEGVIAKWNVKEGDKVNSGDIIAEVETDKATMDVEVFDSGTILKIFAKEGDAVPLGGKMAVIGEEGEDISEFEGDDSSGKKEKKDDKAKEKTEKKSDKNEASSSDESDSKEFDPLFGDLEEDEKSEQSEESDDDSRLKASPLARKMASDQGIKLSQVSGSGPNGRIIKRDIESFDKKSADQSAVKSDSKSSFKKAEPMASGGHEDIPVSQMRKAIARRLGESKFTNPHFYETIDIDMKKAIEVRTSLNAIDGVKISFNDIVVKAAAVSLRRHPAINSSWMGDFMRQHNDVHVAVAVAVPDGLVTPVVRHTDKKGLSQIGEEVKILAGKARDRKLQPDEMEGSTFTISNLGMFGIEEFTAIINPPNACILAVGAIRDVPVVENGEVVPGKRMKVTLSSDHRIVDGAKAAEFLQTLRSLIENPMNMLL